MTVLSRRNFLIASGAAAAATLAPTGLLAAVRKRMPAPAELSTWPSVRAQFALAPGYAHFSSFFLVSHPKPVRDAIEALRRELDENPLLVVERNLMEQEGHGLQVASCRSAAAYLGGRAEEIALTPNTTTGLALVYHGLMLEPGDEVLTTTHDHFVHHESIRLAAARAGAKVRKVALHDRPSATSVETIAARVRAAIRPTTRVLGVTWVHSSTGVRLPIRAIADAVRDANRGRDPNRRVLLVVDGVHGLGAVDETVADLGCDFFCAGTHKWIFAPRGTGIVWGNPEAWARIRPTIPSFSSFDPFAAWMEGKPLAGPNTAARVSPGGFIAYEHQWAMGEAFRFHERIGRARVAARIRALNDQAKEGLAGMRGITLHTPRDAALSAGLVCFEVNGQEPDAVVKALLERRIVASSSPYKTSYVRLAPSLVNDEKEVDDALRAVRAISTT